MPSCVRRTVILAAGNGDRFRGTSTRSKLLTLVGGTPILIRTLRSARAAGLTDAHVVLGYDAERVRAVVSANVPAGLTVHFHFNPRWHEENGVSVLTTRAVLFDQAFALLMGDHLFDPGALDVLLRTPRRRGEILLGVDACTTDPDIVAEATKVRMTDGRILAIGKQIAPFDALDTGLFVCDGVLFDALERSCGDGDTTLSGGIRRLAAAGRVRGCDIGWSRWCDVDTVADLRAAEDIAQLAAAS
jgi:choline kinase